MTTSKQNEYIIESLKRIEDALHDHCIRHEEWDRKLAEHELVIYGKRDGSNGEAMGILQKCNTMWRMRNNAGDVLWKVVSALAVAGALLIAGLK